MAQRKENGAYTLLHGVACMLSMQCGSSRSISAELASVT
jgi:hypothetical protein